MLEKLNKTPRVWFFPLTILSLQYNDSMSHCIFVHFFLEWQKYQAPTFLKCITDIRKVA